MTGKSGRKKYNNKLTENEKHKLTFVKTCPICNTEFDTYGFTNWAYRTKNIYFCSYSCAREFDKNNMKEGYYEED